jgi:hypothetical protein
MRRCCRCSGLGALLEIPWGWKDRGRNAVMGFAVAVAIALFRLLLEVGRCRSAGRLAARCGNGKYSVGYVACDGYQDKYLR